MPDSQPSVLQQAASAFHRTVVAELYKSGVIADEQLVADLLDIEQADYLAAQRGRFGSLDLVHCWIERWSAEGYPELELVVRTKHATVSVIQPRQDHLQTPARRG